MAKPPTDWPLLLAGPILRRVEPTGVSVFMALKHAREVALTVFDGGTTVAQGTAATLAVGQYLHVAVVTATPTAGALVPGKIRTRQRIERAAARHRGERAAPLIAPCGLPGCPRTFCT